MDGSVRPSALLRLWTHGRGGSVRSPYKGGACRPALFCLPAITSPSKRIYLERNLSPSTPLLIQTQSTFCLLHPSSAVDLCATT